MVVLVIVAVVVVIVMIVIVLAVLVVHVAGLAVGRVQELRLQLDDALQVEAAAAEDRVQRHVGALGAVDRRPAG